MKNYISKRRTGFKKRNNGHRTIIIALIALCISGTISFAFASNIGEIAEEVAEKVAEVFSVSNEDETKEKAIENEKRKAEKAEQGVIQRSGIPRAVNEADIKKQMDAEIEEAIGRVELPASFEADISNRSDSARILKNVKTIIADKSLNANQQERFEVYITANADVTAVCSLYDYLFDNFFTEADMNSAIERYNDGEGLDRILDTYANTDNGYIAHNYPEGMLEYLLYKKGVSIDELYVAEIISQRGLLELDTIIERLSDNEIMTDICAQLSILNVACRRIAVTISSSEVQECIDQLGISEDEAIKKIVEAKKAKVPDKDIINYIRADSKLKGETLEEFYLEKFEGRTAK